MRAHPQSQGRVDTSPGFRGAKRSSNTGNGRVSSPCRPLRLLGLTELSGRMASAPQAGTSRELTMGAGQGHTGETLTRIL